MADSKTSKFLKKSKWGKIFKEDDSAAAVKLNDDVADFLRPPTGKSVPKLDIAIAQRWPDANDVRVASAATSPFHAPMAYAKPRRRKGLAVSFASTPPDVIGEGGEEALEPVSEVGRQKAMMSRSASEKRVAPLADGTVWPSSANPPSRQARMPPSQDQDDFRPGQLRRVQTSHNEISPAMQRRIASPPLNGPVGHRPSLGRTPTGFSQHSDEHSPSIPTSSDQGGSVHVDARDRAVVDTRLVSDEGPPHLQTSFGHELGQAPYGSLSARAAASPVAQKQREMRTNEGMAFRRASTMMLEDDDYDKSAPAPDPKLRTTSAVQSPGSLAAPTSYLAFSPSSNTAASPTSAVSPSAPNPFSDPNYLKRRSREPASESSPGHSQWHVDEGLEPQPRQPERSHESGATIHQRAGLWSKRSPAQSSEELGHQQTANVQDERQPTLPQLAPPHDSRSQSRQMQAAQQSMLPLRAVPGRPTYQNMGIPQVSHHERSPSRDRVINHPIGVPRPSSSHENAHGSSSGASLVCPGSNSPVSAVASEHSRAPRSSHEQGPSSPRSQSSFRQGSKSSAYQSGQMSMTSESYLTSPQNYTATSNDSTGYYPHSYSALKEQGERQGPASGGSTQAVDHAISSPLPQDPATNADFADFVNRVAHMKGVFALTAEKERQPDSCSSAMWLRVALWWFLRGKIGAEALLQRPPRDVSGQPRELLTQAHVDLAKSCWILTDRLDPSPFGSGPSLQGAHQGEAIETVVQRGAYSLRGALKVLVHAMAKSGVLPPTQSLIQGQDTSIWLQYPRLPSDVAALLKSNASQLERHAEAIELLPLGDTRDMLCYNRFLVDVHLSTQDPQSVFHGMLTLQRGIRDYQVSLTLASQSELVGVVITPRQDMRRGLTWQQVSWKSSSCSLVVHLPRGFELTVRMQERDFRSVWNMSQYARAVEMSLHATENEKLVHQSQLVELQYSDSSNSHAFPAERVKGCRLLIYERCVPVSFPSGSRKVHEGFRMLLVTDPAFKTLSSVNHEISNRAPLLYELVTDAAAHGTAAMIVRLREQHKQYQMLFVFPDMGSRQGFCDILNGLTATQDETVVGRMSLNSLSIEPVHQSQRAESSALQALRWQKLLVINRVSDDSNSRISPTVESDRLRLVARHDYGCITDRLNLNKGAMLFRLPCTDVPVVHILRQRQDDMSVSIDTRAAPAPVSDSVAQIHNKVQHQPSIRTFTFASTHDLHDFQLAITGFAVRYDGMASILSISRRRMVVPIYKKWEASHVRLQIVANRDMTVFQFLAFMEDFSHADALCFQIKSTDTFEQTKGDGKGKKWSVKMVDAKFSLPKEVEKGESPDEAVKAARRFVNIEGLDYAEEHDDVTVGFETEGDRDRFADALPAATSVSRGMTLKRRI